MNKSILRSMHFKITPRITRMLCGYWVLNKLQIQVNYNKTAVLYIMYSYSYMYEYDQP